MNLPPAEIAQSEETREPTDFWLGFAMGLFTLGFWIAVGFGTGLIAMGGQS